MRLLTATFAVLFFLSAPWAARADAAGGRPNFVFLIADDQRADALGIAGHRHLKTPHLDRLAQQGVQFSNAFVTTAICCTSRADMLTGSYAKQHGVLAFNERPSAETIAGSYPQLLRKAGYRVGMLGKWGMGLVPELKFDYWNAWSGQGSYFHVVDGKRVHNSRYLADEAEKFLRNLKPDVPFCLTVCYKSPHEPFEPDPELGGLFAGATFAKPKTYTAEDFQSQPEFIQTSEGRARLNRRHPTDPAYQEFLKKYLGCVASIDASVGRILDVLDELKLSDNTVVIYTSDHGFFLGEHGLSGKWLMYEESIRVPLIVRDPRLPANLRGQKIDALALSIDLGPTILDLAGMQVPSTADGRSLKPFLRSQQPPSWRTHFYYEHHFSHHGLIPRCEGVRTSDWKYIAYYPPTSYDLEQPLYEQVFHLPSDPYEEQNLAADARYEQQIAALRQLYQAEAREHSSALGRRRAEGGSKKRKADDS